MSDHAVVRSPKPIPEPTSFFGFLDPGAETSATWSPAPTPDPVSFFGILDPGAEIEIEIG
jgi:hypothetical protein